MGKTVVMISAKPSDLAVIWPMPAAAADLPFWKRVIETGNQTESDLDRAIT